MPYKLGSTGFTILIHRGGKWIHYRSFSSREAARIALSKLKKKYKHEKEEKDEHMA